MALFVYVGRDGPQGAELRKRHRSEHLEHIARLGNRVHFGGPLLDDAGKPCGSLILFEADDLTSARTEAESDPYLTRGIFGGVEVFETRQVAPDPGKS